MPTRYDYRSIFFNSLPLYDKLFEERHVPGIRHYSTPDFNFPTQAELGRMTKKRYIWKAGDRYYKLSIENYGTPQYWWIIALFNQKPTDASLSAGDLIYIPLPLETVLRAFTKS